MKLSDLKIVVAEMFHKDVAALTVGSTDLFLNAANNARRRAELLHDFEGCRITADLTLVGGSGGALSGVTNVQGDATGGVKNVTAILRANDAGFYRPVSFSRFDVAIEESRLENSLHPMYWFDKRYRDDNTTAFCANSVVQLGRKLFMYPFDVASTTSVAIRILGFGWLPLYTSSNIATSDVDFIVAYGYEYLQWAIVVELNHIFKEFVPRQEGNLPSPEKLRDEAWRNLLLWDSYSVDSSLTRSY